MRNLFFFLLATFLCIQCTNECIDENIKLGNKSFSETTLDFLDFFEGKDSISFRSYDGQVRTHLVEQLDSTNPILCVKVTCRPTYQLDGLNGCEYYDADDRYYNLIHEDLVLSIQAGMELEAPETENYFEYINVGIENQDTSYYAGVITAANSSDPLTIQNSILSNYFEYKLISEFSEYERILEYQNDDVIIIFKKGKGIVGYSFNNVRWTLID